jgi:predicted nucleic acid-binding protein
MATTDASDPRWFVDANILVFAANPLSPWHAAAVSRLQETRRDGVSLVVNPQVVREFMAAASRPPLGGPPPPIDPILENVRRIRTGFVLVDECAATIDRLTELLKAVPTQGKQVHDANIVATMLTYGIPTLLTHNTADFARFAALIQIVPLMS